MIKEARCIAHEIRNQISICELYSEIIKKNLEKEGIENNSIENAIKCIKKSLKIMNNSLLDLKSLDNLSPDKYNLNILLETGIELSTVYIYDKKITIEKNINNDAMVYVDENKFIACIVNIIKNAIEAIEEEGKIKVSLEVKKELALIKISNNGTPITNPEKIFSKGFTTKSTGNGLGLPICAENLKSQNAELRLSKSTPQITEFEIVIPIYKN